MDVMSEVRFLPHTQHDTLNTSILSNPTKIRLQWSCSDCGVGLKVPINPLALALFILKLLCQLSNENPPSWVFCRSSWQLSDSHLVEKSWKISL